VPVSENPDAKHVAPPQPTFFSSLKTSIVLCLFTPMNAASTAIYFHAESGILAQKDIGEISSKASDLFRYLPLAINQITENNNKKIL